MSVADLLRVALLIGLVIAIAVGKAMRRCGNAALAEFVSGKATLIERGYR